MRIVFIVGADRAGKSTLTDEFVKAGWVPKHFDPPKKSPYAEYREYADWLAAEGDPDGKYVIDRYMYCEFAYSKHYGRTTDMTVGRMHEIEDDLLRLDPSAAVVYCETDLESNWRRIQDEGKGEFKSRGELVALRDEYRRVLFESKLDIVVYDFTKGDTPAAAVAKVEARRGGSSDGRLRTRKTDEDPRLRAAEALCGLSERCHAVAKFSESGFDWYAKSEQYAAAACELMDKVILQMKEEQ